MSDFSSLEEVLGAIETKFNSALSASNDPSEFSKCDKKISQKYKKLDFILNTHHHFDHVGGNIELKKKYGSKILGF